MSLITATKDLGVTRDFTILDGNGDTIVPQTNDKVRAIVGRVGRLGSNLADAKLTVTSGEDTSNGSSFTKNSPSSGKNRLRLDASDLDFDSGTYTLFLEYFDNADAQEWKNISCHVFVLLDR